jgi:hypothetical protein
MKRKPPQQIAILFERYSLRPYEALLNCWYLILNRHSKKLNQKQ